MFEQADLVYSYTRAEAIADGVLVDVTEKARRVGFRYPTVVSDSVWKLVDAKTDQFAAVTALARLLVAARDAIKRSADDGDRIRFDHLFETLVEPRAIIVHIGPGDTPEPVITIMLPGDD